MPILSRRQFVIAGLAGTGLVLADAVLPRSLYPFGPALAAASPGSQPILAATIGTPQRYDTLSNAPTVGGDTYFADWASDGTVYITSCDCSDWSGNGGSSLMLGKLAGDPATPSTLQGYDVNTMNGASSGQINFGPVNYHSGPDNRTWKAAGFMVLDNALYYSVYRQLWDGQTVPWAQDVSIIRSTDFGANWTNHQQAVNTVPPIGSSAMFPGGKFGMLDFIKYGQDGSAPPVDGADNYVYAYSPDCTVGLACRQQSLVLARCLRTDMHLLDRGKWQYYVGSIGADGTQPDNWSPTMSDAQPIWTSPGGNEFASHGDLIYNAALGRYVLIMFAESGGEYRLYEAPHPWGPYTKICDTVVPHDMRQPTLCTKYIANSGTRMWMLSSGWGSESYGNNYCLWTTQIDLAVGSSGTEIDGSAMSMHGSWSQAPNGGCYNGTINWSSTPGDYATYTFTGTSLVWLGGTNDHHGKADVSIDGIVVATVDTYTPNTVLARPLFSIFGLSSTQHILQITLRGDKNAASNGYDTDIDALIIGSSIPAGTMINDTDGGIGWAGSWTYTGRSGCYNSDLHYSNTPGDYVQYTFAGTSFIWYAGTAYDHGKVDVTVDGTLTTTIDTYSANRTTQQPLFAVTGLTSGTHTVRITLRGDKNPAASNDLYQEVDAFLVGSN